MKTKKKDSESRSFIKLILFVAGGVAGCLLLLMAKQFFFAAILAAFAIWLFSVAVVPAMITRLTLRLIQQSRFKEAEQLSRLGGAWSRTLHIGAIGRLPRSIAWDVLIKKNLGQALLQQARFKEAIDVYKELLELVKSENDFDGIAQISGNLAFCYTATGRIREAEGLLNTAVTLLESAVRNVDPNSRLARAHRARLCTALFEQATLLETKRDYTAAESVRRHAIDVARQLFDDPDDVNVMPHMAMLGRVLLRLGKFEEAQTTLNKVLAIRLERLEKGDLRIASAKQALGKLYLLTDRLDEASALLTEALEETERTGGKQHPSLCDYKADLAKLKLKLGNYDEAGRLLSEAMSQKEEQGGKQHPDLIDYLIDMADLQECKGNTDEAEQNRERARQIKEAI